MSVKESGFILQAMRNHRSTLSKKRGMCDQIFISKNVYVADVQNTEGGDGGEALGRFK